MTVFRKGRYYHYRFRFHGQRYRGSTDQTDRLEAELVEAAEKKRVRNEAHGIAAPDRLRTPDFNTWAAQYLRHQKTKPKPVKRPDAVVSCLHVLLEFFGHAPKTPRKQAVIPHVPAIAPPYHDLRLLDLVTEPAWFARFEDWMTARGISGSRKNSLRSTLSGMCKLAVKPAWRKQTGLTQNPAVGLERDAGVERTRVLSVAEIRGWMALAPYHLRVAMAVAVLAPKLRLGNILALRFGREIDKDLTLIRVDDHKASRHRQALVVPLVLHTEAGIVRTVLGDLLADVREQNKTSWVVEYQGGPVKSVKTATQASAEAAGLVYGTKQPDGVTFHTIRHSMATLMATFPSLSERLRADVMGQTVQTVQKYTHLAGTHQGAPHAAIATAVPLADLFGGGVKIAATPDPQTQKQAQIRTIPRRIARKARARKALK